MNGIYALKVNFIKEQRAAIREEAEYLGTDEDRLVKFILGLYFRR